MDIQKFYFASIPFPLSGKVIVYICPKCHFGKCVPIDYHSKRGFHHIYKED